MPCYFGTDNVFEKPGTVTVTNEADGYPKENGYDWLLYDFWQPGATGDQSITIELNNPQICNYVAIAGHNLGDTVTAGVTASYSDDGAAWTEHISGVTIQEDSQTAMLVVADSPSAKYWRVTLTEIAATTRVGHVSLGYAFGFPLMAPFVPPMASNIGDQRINMSRDGIYLGNTYHLEAFDMRIRLKHIAPAVARQWFPGIINHIYRKPFFFSWNNVDYPEDAAFCWLTKAPKNYKYDNIKFTSFNVNAVGIR
jgi:hypothetical protein